MESALLRGRKHGIAQGLCAVLLRDSLSSIERDAEEVVMHCSEPEMIRERVEQVHSLCGSEGVDVIAHRREIAKQLSHAGRYAL
jgi:hypothetical protein